VFSLLGGLVAGAIDIIYACIYNYLRRGTLFKMSYAWTPLISGLLIHMLGIGLPISLAVRWGSR
jgi:hypothetical protein